MSEPTILCSGYLKKSPPERRLMRTWHRRYFVLKSDKRLAYYPSEKDKKPVKEPIDLNCCQSIEANLHHNNKHFKHVFSIRTTKRTFYLVADTREDMDKWIKHLCKCCGFEKQDGKPSPDFLRNRSETKPKDINIQSNQTPTLSSPMTPSPPAICPLSLPKPSPSQLSGKTSRSFSDPPDADELIRKAERQYIENRERRRSTEISQRSPGHFTMTLPTMQRVPEYSNSPQFNEVDGGYDLLKPGELMKIDQSNRLQPQASYSTVPKQRPKSGELYDVVPSHNRLSRNSDDLYDTLPIRGNEPGANYDVVPPPRPVSSEYDKLPNRNSYNPEQWYDTLPNRRSGNYDVQGGDVYDIVPPPRSQSSDSPYYDTLPPPQKSDDIYDVPPNMSIEPPARPPKPSHVSAKDHYDIVPAPGNRPVKQESLGIENRDSGSYSDEIYDVPPSKQILINDDDVYDVPPRINNADVYDELPRRDFSDDMYDTPPALSSPASAPPAVDRSSKPPPVCRSTKPIQDYSNHAPPIDRKSKPSIVRHHGDDIHSYENMDLPVLGGTMVKSQSFPETDVRNYQEKDHCDMQPYRAEDTRCYSFSKECHVTADCYEEMEPQGIKRESGVHSNSSSSEDGGDAEECYMEMGPPDKFSHSRRKAALQYCEVQIVDVETKSHVAVPRRTPDSNYTTINEESTQAFLQTCREQETSRH